MQTLAKRGLRDYNPRVPITADLSPLVAAAAELRDAVNRLNFGPPVQCVYNPLDYAWAAHEQFLSRYGGGAKRALFLGMNPGPFGMAQVGVPFGEVAAGGEALVAYYAGSSAERMDFLLARLQV